MQHEVCKVTVSFGGNPSRVALTQQSASYAEKLADIRGKWCCVRDWWEDRPNWSLPFGGCVSKGRGTSSLRKSGMRLQLLLFLIVRRWNKSGNSDHSDFWRRVRSH